MSPTPPQKNLTIEQATAALRSGDSAAAERIAGELRFSDVPATRAEALHTLGLIHGQNNQWHEASDCFTAAISIRRTPRYFLGLGHALRELRRLEESAAAYRQALAQKPDYAEASDGLGVLAAMSGNAAEAIEHFQKAISLRPTLARSHLHLSRALAMRKLPSDQQAIVSHLQTALSLDPDLAQAHYEIAMIHGRGGYFDRAEASLRKCLAITPNDSEALTRLGAALAKQNRYAEAAETLVRARSIKGDEGELLLKLGDAQLHAGQGQQAADTMARALQIVPDNPLAHTVYGMALITLGDFQGWHEYRHRFGVNDFPDHDRKHTLPIWNGQTPGAVPPGDLTAAAQLPASFDAQSGGSVGAVPVQGRNLIVHAEQGFGDQIMFCRYVPLLIDRGWNVTLECDKPLMPLLQSLRGNPALVERYAATPPMDFRVPLLDLPAIFQTTTETVPPAPYLSADSQRKEKFAALVNQQSPSTKAVGAAGRNLRIGLVWAGRMSHRNDKLRSMELAEFAPLAQAAPGATFFSLQKREPSRAATAPPPGMKWVDLTHLLEDFADTAALVDAMDLLVTVDTAIAHVAGAIGKPVWLLLPNPADFRWMKDRSDTPWYSKTVLFRQREPGNFKPAIVEIAERLRAMARD